MSGVITYGYVGGNPLGFVDPLGLEAWGWDGMGDTAICKYYDELSEKNPSCGYSKTAAKICRGGSWQVNYFTRTAIVSAWAWNKTDKSESEIFNLIRRSLVFYDKQARESGRKNEDGCTCGDTVDFYHIQAFSDAGLNPIFYGGNFWPQNRKIWPFDQYDWRDFGGNPVPYDSRGNDPIDDFFN